MTPLPLVFSAPRRGKPPRHLADLSAEQRAEAVAALGEKPFRAKQLSRHYFARLSVDAPTMTDIPQPARCSADKSARCRGGLPRCGAEKTSGSEDMIFLVSQLSRAAIMTCAASVDF